GGRWYPARHRRGEGARIGRPLCPGRAPLQLCGGDRRGGRGQLRDLHPQGRDRTFARPDRGVLRRRHRPCPDRGAGRHAAHPSSQGTGRVNTVASKSVSEVLAEQSASIAAEPLDERTCHAFSRACIDFITCTTNYTSSPVTEATLRHFSKTDLGRQSSVIGRRERLSPASAAFVTSTSTHGLDLDDGHTRAGGHPGASIFPATFAMAEHLGSGSGDIIRATVAGYNT